MKYSVAATATALAMLGTGLVQAEDTCVTSMYGGGSSTCVILTGKIEGPGKGKCWGTGAFGRLGQGNVQNLGDQPNEMGVFLPIIDVGTGKLIEQFGNGYQHQCVRLNDGTAKCWGYNNLGQLGQGDTEDRGDQPNEMGDNLPAINVGSGRTVKFITAGTGFTCVILDTEDVKCWGANPFGELGLGDTLNRGNVTGQMGDDLPTVSLGSGLKAVEVRGGGWHVCVRITSNNRIKCWGHNIYGQLGLGDTLPRGDGPNEMGDNLPFVDLGAVSTVMQIGIGDLFTCILLTNSKIKCYGFNLDGELGQGVDDQPVGGDPTDMGDNLLYTDIGSVTPDFISCGQESCCVYLTPAGTGIKCWGFNNRGRLGYGDTFDRGDNPGEMGDNLPLVNVGTGMIILEVVTLGTHVCVRIDDQIDLKCWGNNGQGRLGIGNTVHKGDDANEMGNNLGWTPICPTASPTKNPTKTPTNSPTPPTKSPTKSPSAAGATPNPTNDPTKAPTTAPTYSPTNKPSVSPTKKPTNAPSFSPTNKPTFSPTNKPTNAPSFSPTKRPSAAPVTSAPSAAPVTPVPTTSGQTVSPSLSPTKKPSIAPSASPSKKPTNAPSFSPTKKPSNNPTVTPSRAPTAQPTSSPSKSPTQKPISFNKFFGSGGESIGGISSLDLYYLIDRSGSIKDIDYKCKKVQTISGNPAPSCWDLMLGYAIELVKAIATVTGYYDANNPKSGLRVMAVAFFCKPSQDIPDYVNILPSLTGKEVDILDGLNNARKKMNPEGGSCPDTALMRFIQQVEDVWSESKDRPFKLLVTITDAVFYNGQTTESTLLERELYTLKQRCTPGLTMTIDIKNQLLNEKQKLVQERYLQVFTNGVKASRFDLLPGQPVTLQNMGVQMGNLLATQFNNPTCTDPTAFTTPGSLWCGYTTAVRCDVRAGCKWFGELGCLVDPQITGCGFTSKRTCKKASGCKWLSKKGTSVCVKDVDFTDCGSIFLAKSCKEKSLCKWKASTCINKTTG